MLALQAIGLLCPHGVDPRVEIGWGSQLGRAQVCSSRWQVPGHLHSSSAAHSGGGCSLVGVHWAASHLPTRGLPRTGRQRLRQLYGLPAQGR